MQNLSINVPFDSPYSMLQVKQEMAHRLAEDILKEMLDGKRRIVAFTPLVSSIDGFDTRFTLRVDVEMIHENPE